MALILIAVALLCARGAWSSYFSGEPEQERDTMGAIKRHTSSLASWSNLLSSLATLVSGGTSAPTSLATASSAGGTTNWRAGAGRGFGRQPVPDDPQAADD